MKFSVAVVCAAVLTVVSAEIGSDLGSTLKIVGRLCYFPGDHSDPIAHDFFACYDNVPEQKSKFTACQESVFGNNLDTKKHIDVACMQPWLLYKYATCLKTQFAGDEEGMNSAVLAVNQCQGGLMGLE